MTVILLAPLPIILILIVVDIISAFTDPETYKKVHWPEVDNNSALWQYIFENTAIATLIIGIMIVGILNLKGKLENKKWAKIIFYSFFVACLLLALKNYCDLEIA